MGRRLERKSGCETALVPLLLTGVRHNPPGRTDKNLCRCFGAPAYYLLTALTYYLLYCTEKPRGSGWDSGRTKLPNPRAPPTPSDADRGGGWERVRRDCRAEGSLEATAQSKR